MFFTSGLIVLAVGWLIGKVGQGNDNEALEIAGGTGCLIGIVLIFVSLCIFAWRHLP